MNDTDPNLIENREQLGAALTTLRLRAGLTIRDLAVRAGLPSATVGGYVTAKHLPGPGQVDQFRAVLAACGVSDEESLARWDDALLRVRASSDGRAGRRHDLVPPYRGLEPFQPDDADLFFGRDEFVGLVLARLAEMWHGPVHPSGAEPRLRMLFVVGASGSGKSSLLRAGVYPAVVNGDAGWTGLAGPPSLRWQATIMVPGATPCGTLERTLAGVGTPRLLIIDQFEEVFTLTADETERAQFLADLAAVGPDTLIVAGMRADFFQSAARDRMLISALQDWQMVVPPLSQDELRAAIVGPATVRGVAVEDALVESVLADVYPHPGAVTATRQNALPMLSHALLSAWEQRRRGRLTLVDYRGAGGLAGAVQQSAEEAFAALSAVDQEFARRLFLRLVNVAEDLVITRRRIDRAEIEALDTAGTISEGFAAMAWQPRNRDAVHRAAMLRNAAAERGAAILRAAARVRTATFRTTTRSGFGNVPPQRSSDESDESNANDANANQPIPNDQAIETLAAQQRAADHAAFGAISPTAAVPEPAVNGGSANDTAEPSYGPIARVIERFVSRRLITVDADTVEISHDALLTAWPRLAEWIANDHAGLRVHRRLTSGAQAWQETEFDDQQLLRGAQLVGVEEWARDPDHFSDLNRLERDFLIASANVRDRDHANARRRTAVLRGAVASLAVLLLVAVASLGYALVAGHSANIARDNALSREVAIESARALSTDPALAQQLALAAYRIARTVDARSAVLDSTARGVVNRRVGTSGPTTMRLSPDGDVLAVSDAVNGTVALYEYSDDRPTTRLGTVPADTATDQLFALAFSSDGHTLAVGGARGTVRLFDVTHPAHPVLDAVAPGRSKGAIEALAFNPSGTVLVAGSKTPALRVWSVTDPRHPGQPFTPADIESNDTVQALRFSPDGSMLAAAGVTVDASGGGHGVLRIWRAGAHDQAPAPDQTPDLQTAATTVTIGDAILNTIAFAPDSRHLITGGNDDNAVVVDLANTPAVSQSLDTGFTSWTNAAAFSPDGRLAAIGSADGKLDVFDASTWKPIESSSGSSQVTAVAYSPDSQVLLDASADGTVRSRPAREHAITGLDGPVFSIGYDRSGSRLAVGAHNVTLWSTTGIGTGTRAEPPTQLTALVNPPPFGHSDGTEAMTPDGLLVATANSSGRVLVGRVTAGGFDDSTLRTFSAGTQTIEALAASPNGRLIAAGSDDGHVYLFDVSHPSNRTALPALKAGKEVAYVAFSPNGRYVAGASIDHRVHLWDISDPSNAKALPSLGGFTNYAWSVTFSPDSKLLAAGGADDKVIIWNITRPDRPKRVAGPMNGPSHYVFSLAFSPNGRTLAAAGGDGSVWTWALSASGSARPTTMLHVADVGGSTYAVAFSPDGATLAAGGSAGEVVLWGTDPDAAASAICAAGGDQLTRAEWAQYVPGVPYRTLCSSG